MNRRYDFETAPNREHLGNLKHIYTPQAMKDVHYISMNGAEMDFKTAPVIRNAVAALAENGLFGFTLKDKPYEDAVMWWMKSVRSWEIRPEWIVTALGTIYSCATMLRLFVGPGDAMIVQPPVYYRYEQAARRLGKRTVYNRMEVVDGEYRIDFEDLEKKMADPHNTLLVICNPQNPTGRVFTREELKQIAQLSAKYKVPVYSDEIFAEYTYGDNPAVPYASIEEGRAYAVTCTSLGKAFNLTGVNHANLIIPDDELRARVEEQRTKDHYGSIDPMAYVAVTAAYSQEGYAWLQACKNYMGGNLRLLEEFAQRNREHVRLFPVEGTYVAWMKFLNFHSSGKDPEELVKLLRKTSLTDMGPGTEYDSLCENYIRINFSTQHSQMREALERVEKALASITEENAERKK